ncbi:hypothetical protein E2320_019986 [Naja naja]|nr:hypothetical protein E2320_019986 [Naja naja]
MAPWHQGLLEGLQHHPSARVMALEEAAMAKVKALQMWAPHTHGPAPPPQQPPCPQAAASPWMPPSPASQGSTQKMNLKGIPKTRTPPPPPPPPPRFLTIAAPRKSLPCLRPLTCPPYEAPSLPDLDNARKTVLPCQNQLCNHRSQASREIAAPSSFAPFHLALETWDSYINRFECFIEANDLVRTTSNLKKAYFLSFCGAEIFDTARSLLAPQTVQSVSWDTLQDIPGNHYMPKPSQIAHRHAFHHRNKANPLAYTWWRYEGQSSTVDDYSPRQTLHLRWPSNKPKLPSCQTYLWQRYTAPLPSEVLQPYTMTRFILKR